MNTRLAIVGDFKPDNRSHAATNDAIRHCAAGAGLSIETVWVGTEEVAALGGLDRLSDFGGFWVAPASPYKNMEGALAALRLARENHIPLLGTCGGFQHLVLEYARNVLGLEDAQHEESEPGASRLFISRLNCSLVGRSMNITLEPGSLVARLYGRSAVTEQYHCNFGVNPEYVDILRSGSLRIVASDDEGVVRAVELPSHPFFIGTLFLPQHTSTSTAPHPLISGFLRACSEPRPRQR